LLCRSGVKIHHGPLRDHLHRPWKRPTDFLRESVLTHRPKELPVLPGAEGKTPPEILVYGRNGGGANSPGWNIRVVPNRFPALGIEGDLDREGEAYSTK